MFYNDSRVINIIVQMNKVDSDKEGFVCCTKSKAFLFVIYAF